MASLNETSTIDESTMKEYASCPYCRLPAFHSHILYQSDTILQLRCDACHNDVSRPNNESERQRLSFKFGVPVVVQRIRDIRDLAPGDVIGYRRRVTVLKHTHHAVVLETDKPSLLVTLIEFVPHFPLRWGRVSLSYHHISSIVANSGWVMRFLPLDCRPVGQVIEEARKFVQDPTPPMTFSATTNSQHLVSWCKCHVVQDLEKMIPSVMYQASSSHDDSGTNSDDLEPATGDAERKFMTL